MTTLSASEVTALFDEHQAKFPVLTEKIGELKTYYNEKDKIVEVRTLADLDQTLFVQITNGQLR